MRPRLGYAKLNVDASFDVDSLAGSVGAVLPDHTGKFLAAANERIEICLVSFTPEAIAVRFGINLARTIGCNKTEIKSDSLEVVSALNEGYSSSVASAIFDDCYFMSLDFNHVIYEHYNRENNMVADELARIASFSPPSIWLESPPVEVIPLIVNDTTLVTIE
ncbi:uncharacterized protein [Aegilops tauschii subsp. strangulata]|uniref:uncharacterized protein n=1 Tax=Aegilops tauschii subsp. strangulata TaxID=200361 RepID=UPI003CC8ADE8